MKKVNPIPEGYHTITPYLIVKGAAKAIKFYKDALGAVELFKMEGPEGSIPHAELKIGNSLLMLADEFPDMGAKAPGAFGGSPVSLCLYVDDVDASAERATRAGMEVKRPVKDQFYGDRSGTFQDPFGHTWTISTHVEDVSPEEMRKRAAQLFGK